MYIKPAAALTPQPSTDTLQPSLLLDSLLSLTYDVRCKLCFDVELRILAGKWRIDVLAKLTGDAVGDV